MKKNSKYSIPALKKVFNYFGNGIVIANKSLRCVPNEYFISKAWLKRDDVKGIFFLNVVKNHPSLEDALLAILAFAPAGCRILIVRVENKREKIFEKPQTDIEDIPHDLIEEVKPEKWRDVSPLSVRVYYAIYDPNFKTE